ncbi:hypothetical protein DL89DRAFT_180833 [Linderina pennispora]|uniref:P-loop containing nucleoside triphosphate hydrolase protein n=1 Tax=Linderina pennispora TaxID=61395 RepID=A0A1Y1W5D7_9FUNG|nr:uncharacterized protein DL89DRAFT_180833 [Linderina pennispora]ORX68608.1 hypothetical protein DL89DRAFT_180833 [Linderina pennispora]
MVDDKENDAETSAVIIGDINCGKTTLCAAYLDKVFPTHRAMPMYEFDARQATVDLDGHATKLVLRDGSVLEYHERLRPLAYRKASVGIVCVVPNPYDLRNPWIKTFWPQWPAILFWATGATT